MPAPRLLQKGGLATSIRQCASSALDLCLPALCPACHCSAGAALCDSCRQQAKPIQDPCPYCAAERKSARTHAPPSTPMKQTTAVDAQQLEQQMREQTMLSCLHCHKRGFPGIKNCFATYAYRGVIRDLILQAKAKSRRSAQHALCNLLPSDALQSLAIEAVLVIPPSPGRGYGPHLASSLARRLAADLHRPLLRRLRQTRLPAAQHGLPVHMRSHNTHNLFSVAGQQPLPQRVLLVDDVITSGSTLSAAAQALHHAGAKHIYACAVARTQLR